jgi:hypothetical protein
VRQGRGINRFFLIFKERFPKNLAEKIRFDFILNIFHKNSYDVLFLQGIAAKRCCKGTLFLEFNNLKSKKMMKKYI